MFIKSVLVLILFSLLLLSCKSSINSSDPIYPEGKYKIMFASADSAGYTLNTIWSNGTGLKKVTDFTDCYNPKWSFNAEKIIYFSYPKSICVMDSSGNNKTKITDGDFFICSPFENKICFIREEYNGEHFAGWAIYSVNMDGTDLVRLTDLEYQKYGLCWSADPTHIYFTLNDNIAGKFQRICNLNISDKSIDTLCDGYDLPIVDDCSKDGKFLVFSANHAEVFKLDLTTKGVTQLTNAFYRDENASISPKDNKIVFKSGREDLAQVFIMNDDGSDQHNLSRCPDGATYPKYSPDGTMIAYFSYHASIKKISLTICSANEMNKRNLVFSSFMVFEWCPVTDVN